MQFCRVSIVVEDQSGGWLGRVVDVLAAHGGHIVAIDAEPRVTDPLTDDLLVRLGRPLDLPHVALILRRGGIRITELRPAHVDELADPLVEELGIADLLPDGEGTTASRIVAAARRLADVDGVWVAPGKHPSIGRIEGEALAATAMSLARDGGVDPSPTDRS